MGIGNFKAYSAGSHPAGHVHPLAIEVPHKTASTPTDCAQELERVFRGGACDGFRVHRLRQGCRKKLVRSGPATPDMVMKKSVLSLCCNNKPAECGRTATSTLFFGF